jgi:hypothetical protein
MNFEPAHAGGNMHTSEHIEPARREGYGQEYFLAVEWVD